MGLTKNHLTSWGNKSCRFLGQQKIMQPLGTKKNATSQDKKITLPLRAKQNHATSQDKKIKQHVGTKNSAIFRGQNNPATSWDKKNHATAWDKKITQLLRTKKTRNIAGKKSHARSRSNCILISS